MCIWAFHIKKTSGSRGDLDIVLMSSEKIVVGDLLTYDAWKNEREESRKAQERLTLRHEVIHAFLNESGLTSSSNGVDCWALNEEMVDWIAIQYPKIRKVFQQLGCDEW